MPENETIACDGIHAYEVEVIPMGELPELTELFGEFDIMNPPICTRRGRRLEDKREHWVVGTHPILAAMDENATRGSGKQGDFRKAVAAVLDLASQGANAHITMYPADDRYPALKLAGTWDRDDEPSAEEVDRLRLIGKDAYDKAVTDLGLNLLVEDDRRTAMRASIRAIYKEII